MKELVENIDVPVLRRIALLANRVSEDDPGLRPSMTEISLIVDQFKRDIVLGRRFEQTEIKHLKRLLGTATRASAPQSLLEAAMLDELRDLGRLLPDS